MALPRLTPLGDIDEEELSVSAGSAGPEAASLPPAIARCGDRRC
jgi:hypothetical protein